MTQASGFRRLAIVAPVALLALGGCDDPQPGLDAPARVEALERCDMKLASLAANEEQLRALCECTTARLTQQGFTLQSLNGQHRDRAMEQVRWCMTQTGATPPDDEMLEKAVAETAPETTIETGPETGEEPVVDQPEG